jgi:hypothetical protein
MKHSVLFLFVGTVMAVAQPKALFYMTDSPNSVKSFTEHADKIDILVPAWYGVDGNGLMWGGPNPYVLQTAAQHHVPVMPIVATTVQAELHKLFTTPGARNAFVGSILSECRKNGYSGFQIDFENVLWTDRDLLTNLVAETAAALHKKACNLPSPPCPTARRSGESGYSHWLYANWRGAYDLKALAQTADLICLMTYDQNTRWTAPGPVAGYPWTVQQLEYALQSVPKEKLSLGIPVYGYHWFAGEPGKDEKPNPTAEYIGQQEVDQYLAAYHPHPEWDAFDRVAWFYFYKDDNSRVGLLHRQARISGTPESGPRPQSAGLLFVGAGNGGSGNLDGAAFPQIKAQDFANACFAAAIVCCTSCSVCVALKNAASYCDGGRYTPLSSMLRKNLPEHFGIRFRCRIPIRHRPRPEEPGKHRSRRGCSKAARPHLSPQRQLPRPVPHSTSRAADRSPVCDRADASASRIPPPSPADCRTSVPA